MLCFAILAMSVAETILQSSDYDIIALFSKLSLEENSTSNFSSSSQKQQSETVMKTILNLLAEILKYLETMGKMASVINTELTSFTDTIKLNFRKLLNEIENGA